ncbi:MULTISPECIES: ABC transporter ATP-binding protein [Lactobacillus]|uniref:ABC transporter ATP-binding protein n=1 Tax=Lactobacillus xujianguonis TaxID=2495899 RepID=A0A437SX13_9LACO|nr:MULTISPECIES: ATP-binding cassette domain-containing protein [Lactobacillus]RVU71466.1 ABC transporter ATP-binding protein [Lactobacillus xujianguonis]RVU73689.1 ABC transporter ATP-binding protein [Lactobacillus xujianguonis]
MNKNIIEVENVTKQFKKKSVLNGISFSVQSNKIYGFKGPNGSGKTVTFKTILGFVKPSSGTVKVNGKYVRKDVMFAPNTSFAIAEYGLLEDKTGIENLQLLDILNKHHKDHQELMSLLERVGLDPKNTQKLKEYSLGMKQRLLIASALLNDDKIVILDEPTNALDEDGQIFLIDLIQDLKKEGKTILVSSHDKEFLEKVADHIFVFSNGKIVREEDNEE